jgi:uncharacterized membrane protein YjgN (DUF898 family)
MAATSTEYTVRPFSFQGDGKSYFGIWLINAVLTALTMGLYYPWARANRLRYLYNSLELEGSRFTFHGTGAEIFRGFVKVWLVLAIFFGTYIYAIVTQKAGLILLVVVVFLLGLFGLMGLLIHGAMRYRASRTSWRGLHFGYDGSASELSKLCAKGLFLTVITFGIYSFWFTNDLRRYVFGHLRYGVARFNYNGSGTDLFVMAVKAVFLLPLTLYLYAIEYRRAQMAYLFDRLHLRDGDPNLPQQGKLDFSTAYTFSGLFGLLVVNFLLVVFTFGLGYPWAVVRSLRYVFDNLSLVGDLNLDYIVRGADTNSNAAADSALDAIGLEDSINIGDFGLL